MTPPVAGRGWRPLRPRQGGLTSNTGALRAAARAVHRAAAAARRRERKASSWRNGRCRQAPPMRSRRCRCASPRARGRSRSWCASGRTCSRRRQGEDRACWLRSARPTRRRRKPSRRRSPASTRSSMPSTSGWPAEFPEYASLPTPSRSTIAARQALLKPNEALVFPRCAAIRQAARGDAGVGRDQDGGALDQHPARHGGARGARGDAALRARSRRPVVLAGRTSAGSPRGSAAARSGPTALAPTSRCRSTWASRMSSIGRCSRRSPT